MSEYTLKDWIDAKPTAYELSEEVLEELAAMIKPVADRLEELKVPFALVFQGALMDDGITCSLNGTAGVGTPDRASPDIMHIQMLFMARGEIDPDVALGTISQAVSMKLDAQQGEAPAIFIP